MKNIIFTLLLLCTNNAFAEAKECKSPKLYCQIMKFNRNFDKAEAKLLADKISLKAKIAKIDASAALAILIHESGLKNINTYKTSASVEESCDSSGCRIITSETKNVFDMSLAQINIKTAIDYGFDIKRLYKGELDYALDCFFIILKSKMHLCEILSKTPTYSCYHSINDPYRLLYVSFVSRHM
jgi:hypothetical protein